MYSLSKKLWVEFQKEEVLREELRSFFVGEGRKVTGGTQFWGSRFRTEVE